MSLSSWLSRQGPPGPKGDAVGKGGGSLSRYLEESSDPHVAAALARLRGLPRAPNKRGSVLHPFPVEKRPAYKDLPHERLRALIEGAPVVRRPVAGLVSNGQRSVHPERVADYVRRRSPTEEPSREEGGKRGPPIVVRAGGKDVVYDGHHRSTAAYLLGQPDIEARYVDADAALGQNVGP